MHRIEQKLQAKLQAREREGNLRKLSFARGEIDFCSNDYLGLARNAALYRQIMQRSSQHPQNGATGSRLISGNHPVTRELEARLATIFKSESALLFNSGYSANTAILSAIPQRDDTIIYDEYIHASLKEGARLSFAKRFSFVHNDLLDLENKLKKATGDIFVVAESVYSMDGDFAPLSAILALCQKYQANLIWDEAHSTGIWGENGNGIACENELDHRIFARIYTFGKAMGVHGACIVGSKVLMNYLVNFARSFIYTTALPLHSVIAVSEAFNYLAAHPELQKDIYSKIAFFRNELLKTAASSIQFEYIESQSPIQVVKTGGNIHTRTVAERLQKKGFDVRPILSPTVKEGEERLRICLHTYNTFEEIHKLVQELVSLSTNYTILSDNLLPTPNS